MHRFRLGASGSFAAYPRSAPPLMFNEVDGWSRFIRHKQVRMTASHAYSSPSRLVLKRGSAHPPRVGSRFGPSCSPTIPQLGHSPSCSPTILQLGHSPSCSTCFVCFIDDRSIDQIELVPVLCLVNRAVVTIDKAENRHELNLIDRLSIDEGVTVMAHA